MKNRKNKIMTTTLYLLLVAASSFILNSGFSADFQIQNIRVGGTGCPSELTAVALAPDASAASLIFSQFESRVPAISNGPKTSTNISILNCNIFLDIKILTESKLESVDITHDMRGFTTLDRGVQGSFKSYLISKNGMGTELHGRGVELINEKNWNNIFTLQEEDFLVTSTKKILIPSLCSRGSISDIVSIRLQHTLTSQIMAGFENVSRGSITMDSSDITGGFKIRATTSTCSNSNRPVPNPGPGPGPRPRPRR